MDNEIRPGYSALVKDADYTAIAQAVDSHNDAAQTGERYWGIAMTDGAYTVYEAGEVPPPPTAEELAAKEAERKKQAEREALPETVKALQAALEAAQTAQSDTDAMVVDHEYRMALLELGLSE